MAEEGGDTMIRCPACGAPDAEHHAPTCVNRGLARPVGSVATPRAWLLLPECGVTPLRLESESALRSHLRKHYPDRRPTDVKYLYRIPSGGYVHCWEEGGPDDEPEA